MSGGFFRGTSADQDTRFSNKQAKLLKSQKFAPELDHLVDTTKVKMDVIRPWIATRATELLGFEDEVLINFVYGLLDGKEVDGKQIQIQLTGFMEKNTGKFMKELWSLLLSAQKNASGVPQQFLDAKEEEMRKKKVETDRITLEIQKRKEKEKEGRDIERGKQTRMDGEVDISRSTNAVSDLVSKHSLHRTSSVRSEEEREMDVRHGRRTKNGYSRSPRSSKSPHSNDHSPSSRRNSPSPTRSSSKSFSKSRSYSEERHKSRSVSVLSQSQRQSFPPERRFRSPARRSISPARRYRSPPRRSVSPHHRYSPRHARSPPRRIRRRSGSHSRHRSPSPSPSRRRSPHARRGSPSFLRRRSPSPFRRKSPSPIRRRSPVRRRSPSPSRRRSPIRRRSLSPARRRSPSPLRRRSPLPKSPKHRRRSPLHSPRNRATDSQISPRRRKRSRSPYRSRSPSHRTRKSLSRERDGRTNGVESKRYRGEYASHRTREMRSPLHHALDREVSERLDLGRKASDPVSRRLPTSLRSPQRDSRDQRDTRNRVPVVPPEKFPNLSESPAHVRKMNPRKNRRSRSLSESPVKQSRERMTRYDSPETSREEEQTGHAREDARRRTGSLLKESKDLVADKGQKKFHASDFSPEVSSPDRSVENRSPSSRDRPVKLELRKDHEERRDMDLTERHVRRVSPSPEGVEYGPGQIREERFSPDDVQDRLRSTKQHGRDASSLEEMEFNEQAMKNSGVDGHKVNDEKQLPKSDEYGESHYEIASVTKSLGKVDKNNLLDATGSDTEETETYKLQKMEKRRHRKSDKHKKDVDDGSESESQIDDRKEAKRRRKDEKRLRKEERRRRREERHRRRLERRASKLKVKSMDTVAPPSDIENDINDSDESDGDAVRRKDSRPSDTEEPESEQKKLEIELRKKALESLRAKKAISQ